MFKEDIKIKILDEEHFKKVKEILVGEGYDLQSSTFNTTRDFCMHTQIVVLHILR